MRLIKRYSNRKLYDTELRSYITLDGLAALVVGGEEIRVVDNDTDEDLTSVVLSQILLERERAQRFVPSAVLSQLLRGGENLRSNLSKVARPFNPPASLPIPQFLEQEVERNLKFWAELGQSGEEETLRLLESLIEKRRRVRHEIEPAAPRRPRSGLDKFEEWGGDSLTEIAYDLPAGLIRDYLKATQEAIAALAPYAQGEAEADEKEIEKLYSQLNQARLTLATLIDELARIRNSE